MRRELLLFLTVGLLLGLNACVEPERRPYPGNDYGPYDRVDRYDVSARIDNQQRRIDEGVSSGELKRYEADLLIDNLNWIRDEYSRAKRDGRLSQAEIERLSEHLNQNNRMITDKKNNDIRRVFTPLPMPAPAPVPPPRHEPQRDDFRDRMDSQQRSIDQGVSRGDLTRREADMLQENLNHIRDEYGRMKADGRLTPSEADRLDRDLEINSRMIQDKRNNQIRRINEPIPMPAPAPRHEQPRNDIRDLNEHRRSAPGASSDEQPRMDLREIRMENQQNRINQGVASGGLTRRDAAIVQENLDRIRAAYSRMKADGRQTVAELDRIDKKLDRNDNMIHDKRLNAIERLD